MTTSEAYQHAFRSCGLATWTLQVQSYKMVHCSFLRVAMTATLSGLPWTYSQAFDLKEPLISGSTSPNACIVKGGVPDVLLG